jgi:choline-sulfatase
MSLMTGQMPSRIQVLDNGHILASDVPTYAHALSDAGYQVLLCGRMHFGGADQRHGFHDRIFPEVSGHAVGTLVGANHLNRTSLEKSGPGRNHYLLYDTECVAAARRWIERRATRADGPPFCLVVGTVGPHCPFVCPQDLYRKYYDRVTVPRYPGSHWADMHPYNARYRLRSRLEDATEHEIRRSRAAYYGMVEYDDRLIGELLGTLEAAGLAEETMVIYTSDHGEMAGEHGMWFKYTFYEGSCAVPLIVSWPGRIPPGHRVTQPVSLLDLAPTLTDATAAPPLPGATGHSLLPLLRGEHEADREARAEIYVTDRLRDQGPSGGPAHMLRRGDWKCNIYHGERPELFNLARDPGEMCDLASNPAYALLLEEMVSAVLADWDPEWVTAQAEAGRAVRSASGTPVPPEELWLGPEGYGYVEQT